MPLPITAAYAAVLALLVVALGVNVTMHRVKLGVPIGDGGNAQMLRMIRLHGNAVEYIPLALVLMAIYEVNGGWHIALQRRRHRADRRPPDADLGHVGQRRRRLRPQGRPESRPG